MSIITQKMLLHVCCGPCTAYPLTYLRERGFTPTGYFYNPNIHPYKEFRRRLETAQEFAQKTEFTLVVEEDYALEEFLTQAVVDIPGRCRMCYEMRLRKAAQYAKANGFDCFSATLLVSPYQKHDLIRQVGEQIAMEEGIPFYYADYREGWQQGVMLSKELELYRQPYCGCIFSEKERYMKVKKKPLVKDGV